MYRRKQGLTLGFHGCDASIISPIILGESMLKESRNAYDWLGHGSYFWEFDPKRAFHFARELQENSFRATRPIASPAVIGAVLDLGNCLDLLDYKHLSFVKMAYDVLLESNDGSIYSMPQNKKDTGSGDLLLRDLDCAVIESLHNLWEKHFHQPPFDSVRGAFWEGKELYPHAGFREKDHIQICIRNPNCIKGLFRPRKEDSSFAAV
jgi:hypothetical protein